MMTGGRFWARKSDLAAIFEAKHVAYLIAERDAGGLAVRLAKRCPGLLPVPVLQWGEGPKDGVPVSVFYTAPGSLNGDGARELTELAHPPAIFSQLVLWGSVLQKIAPIEAAAVWLAGVMREVPFVVSRNAARLRDRGIDRKRLDRVTAHAFTIRAGDLTALSLALMSGRVDAAEKNCAEMSSSLLDTLEQLSDLQFEYSRLLNAASAAASVAGSPDASYTSLVREVRAFTCEALPRNTTVIVISKGDRELLNLDGRTAWHFPQTNDGIYAGHHPANSSDAISHLDSLRAKGGEYLVIPQTAFWWLDNYREFAQHLVRCGQLLAKGSACAIYALSPEAATKAVRLRARASCKPEPFDPCRT